MAIFKGLRVEILEQGSSDAGTQGGPCEEFRSTTCDEKTRGHTCHQFISLTCNVPFCICISVEDVFDWADANGLCLQIDFDNCTRVYDAEIFIMRHENNRIESALSLKCETVNAAPKVVISSLTQLVKPSKKTLMSLTDEQMSFRTVMLSDETGRLKDTTRRHGEIWIAVRRCKIEKKNNQSRLLSIPPRPAQPTAQKLREAGIYSRIAYSEVQRRPATSIDVKATNRVPIGTFVFLYRTPEQFERIKAENDDDRDCSPTADASTMFEAESPQTDYPERRPRRSPSADPSEASNIVVASPVLYTDSKRPSSPNSTMPAELTADRVLQMHTEYETTATLYHRDMINLQARYAAEEQEWRRTIEDLRTDFQKKEAEYERKLQPLRLEHDILKAKIASQQQDFETLRRDLSEKIQNSKRVSEAFAAGAEKRAKVSHPE